MADPQIKTFSEMAADPDTILTEAALGDLHLVYDISEVLDVNKIKVITTANLLKSVYPVGCIYTTTIATNPALVLGFGTWESFGAGQVLVGVGTSDAVYAAGATGGESQHTLTVDELPSHRHTYSTNPAYMSVGSSGYNAMAYSPQTLNTGYAGGDDPHNNMPPYVVVYFWKRTA